MGRGSGSLPGVGTRPGFDGSDAERIAGLEVLVIGEALIDVVETGSCVVEHVGGSPANVALGLGRRGVRCALLTQLGADRRGALVTHHLQESGVEVLPESFHLPHTSTALAQIRSDGQADYRFDVSWQAFPPPRAVRPRAVHVGSISAFLEPGASSVREALRGSEVEFITFDPNIRPVLMPPHEHALHAFETTAAMATAVKMSDEDASWLYPELGLDDVLKAVLDFGPQLVAITRGGDGAVVASRQACVRMPAPAVSAVDTIGAGDTFMASLICSLLGDMSTDRPALEALTREAVRAAAITVSRAGADVPWLHELDLVANRSGSFAQALLAGDEVDARLQSRNPHRAVR